MRAVSLFCAIGIALAASAGGASATTLTFDFTSAGAVGDTYTDQGFTFAGDGSQFISWGNGNSQTADTSGTSATLFLNSWPGATTLTKVGGGAFHLNSLDFADVYDSGGAVPLTLTFNYSGGGSSSQNIMLDSVKGLETFSFNLPALVSVTWTPPAACCQTVQWDNVVLNAAQTPIPAALPLFASALGGLGVIGWRRKKLEAAA